MGRKLFVGNLPFSTDERRLEELFAAIGPVDTVNIVRDQMTGRARGFAFVEMQTDEAAQTAIQRLNDTDLDGRKIAVNEARPKASGGGGGGWLRDPDPPVRSAVRRRGRHRHNLFAGRPSHRPAGKAGSLLKTEQLV